MLLASHALAAGPLAASQPGFTVLDPLSAGLLGVFLFAEHIRTGVLDLAGEALALAIVIAGASILSHSCLILGEDEESPVRCLPSGYRAQASGGWRELGYQPSDAPEVHTAEPLPPGTPRGAPTAGRAPASSPVSRASGPPVL
jgi:hypothetical protein